MMNGTDDHTNTPLTAAIDRVASASHGRFSDASPSARMR